ncbi:MAG: hypothetical protein Q7R95_02100, partial [bacterium]|nr:hypothetical protein [bacterium]
SNLIRGKNPIKKMRDHGSKRGMDWIIDVHDWFGGYPYEYAGAGELFNYIKEKNPDFNLLKMKSTLDLGNNWLVFKRD